MSRGDHHERTELDRGVPRWFVPVLEALARGVEHRARGVSFDRDLELIERIHPYLHALSRYSSVEIQGWENLPKTGPFLIVANHSGGSESNDVAALFARWLDTRGLEAEIYALAYDAMFALPLLGPLLPRLGVIPASHDNARRAFERGAAVIVFPGGDYEVFRPWSERNRITFGGRKGFIRLGIQAQVPVVPLTIHGAHESTFVLTRGEGVARRLGLHRVRVKYVPLVWNLPFGVVPWGLGSLPLPTTVTMRFGAPLDWTAHEPTDADDPQVLDRCYDEITGLMQRTLDELHERHPHPIRERLLEFARRR